MQGEREKMGFATWTEAVNSPRGDLGIKSSKSVRDGNALFCALASIFARPESSLVRARDT